MLPPVYCTRNILKSIRALHTINPAMGNLQNSSTSKFPKNYKLKKSWIDFFNKHIYKMLKLPNSFSVVIFFLQQERFINFIHISTLLVVNRSRCHWAFSCNHKRLSLEYTSQCLHACASYQLFLCIVANLACKNLTIMSFNMLCMYVSLLANCS